MSNILLTDYYERRSFYLLPQASVSIKRIQNFLANDELDPDAVNKDKTLPGKLT